MTYAPPLRYLLPTKADYSLFHLFPHPLLHGVSVLKAISRLPLIALSRFDIITTPFVDFPFYFYLLAIVINGAESINRRGFLKSMLCMVLLGTGPSFPFTVNLTKNDGPCSVSASVLRMSIYVLGKGGGEEGSSYREAGIVIGDDYLVIELEGKGKGVDNPR